MTKELFFVLLFGAAWEVSKAQLQRIDLERIYGEVQAWLVKMQHNANKTEEFVNRQLLEAIRIRESVNLMIMSAKVQAADRRLEEIENKGDLP